MSETYEEYAARLTDPKTPVRGSGAPLVGDEAAAAGMAFLVDSYGSREAVERVMHRGRPRVGQNRGPSPEVRGRVLQEEFDGLVHLQQVTGRSRSELVRAGVQLLLEQHHSRL